ncbi:MAG TPA: sodium:solute symporter [Gemmatimonadetes bacterium]|nr:sodium:solute symporter [Gemmatimonadota bacterium]
MHWIDWLLVAGYTGYVVWDGLRRTKDNDRMEGFLLANRNLPWWVVGLSVVATQLSAITLVGTTGQGATDGLRFIQFYLGLPLAMLILSVTLLPLLHRARVFTAYEYLEHRFDGRTRTLTSLLFLLSRAMATGVVISAPAVILSALFGWPMGWSVALVGVPAVVYASLGGIQAVAWADVKQVIMIVLGLAAIAVVLILGMPDGVGLTGALKVAGATGHLKPFDFRLSLTETYTFWSGLLGGTFLMMSYFGTDQSQVQRYLAARSVDEARSSLFMSAYWKIPLQALVLLIGVLIFSFYTFSPPPLLFNPAHDAAVRASDRGGEYAQLEENFQGVLAERRAAAHAVAKSSREGSGEARAAFVVSETRVEDLRGAALKLAGEVTAENPRDVNYVISSFVFNELPIGLPGIFIAAVLAAAMSTIAAELNSLATASVIDVYRRRLRPREGEGHYLIASKVATAFWGTFACVVAVYASRLGSLIEVVNRFGSFFYGSILGVFLLALTGIGERRGAFYGLIAGMVTVGCVSFLAPSVSFLWHNVIGASTVVLVGLALSVAAPAAPAPALTDG